MFALRCLAGCVVWVSLLGIIFFLGAIGFIFLYNGGVFGADAAATVATYLNVPKLSTSTQTNQVLGGIFLGLAGLFIIVVLCCCSRIRLAVAVCKCAGQFVGGVCLIVLVPLFQTAVALGVWAGCLIIMIYLVSCTKFISSSSNYFTSIGDYGDENLIRFYCFIFGTLWVNAFIGAVGIFVVASACCMWYFSHGPNSELSLPIARSYKMVFRYHFGSLAFGSFILAIVQFLQFLLEMFKKQADNSGINNKCLEYCTNCMRCCLACIERIVQFLNKTAYIQIALRGKNFCAAAKDGFELVWSNAMRYAIVSGVGEIIMFMGKLMIAAATTALYYCFITYVSSVQVNYQQPIYSLIVNL